MAYHIYTTRGIVLSARPSREADRVYSIFTEDLGLIHARARGVRLSKSKLRGAVEPFSLANVSLVRGQEAWRLTGATLIESLNESVIGRQGLQVLARIASLVERLVVGEEAHKEIFDILEEGAVYLVSHKDSHNSDMLEIIVVLRVLQELGYVSDVEAGREYLIGPLDTRILEESRVVKKRLVDIINHGLRTTQLV